MDDETAANVDSPPPSDRGSLQGPCYLYYRTCTGHTSSFPFEKFRPALDAYARRLAGEIPETVREYGERWRAQARFLVTFGKTVRVLFPLGPSPPSFFYKAVFPQLAGKTIQVLQARHHKPHSEHSCRNLSFDYLSAQHLDDVRRVDIELAIEEEQSPFAEEARSIEKKLAEIAEFSRPERGEPQPESTVANEGDKAPEVAADSDHHQVTLNEPQTRALEFVKRNKGCQAKNIAAHLSVSVGHVHKDIVPALKKCGVVLDPDKGYVYSPR